jgi:hypothetical protein
MVKLEFLNKTYKIPETIAEIEKPLLKQCVETMFSPDVVKKRTKLMSVFVEDFESLLHKFDTSVLEAILHTLSPLLKEKPEGFPFKSFVHGGIEFFCPKINFDLITVWEFVNANMQFQKLVKTEFKDAEALNMLVAILCRPIKKDLNTKDPAWDGDEREKFNVKISENRAVHFDTQSYSIKILAIFYFLAGIGFCQKAFPYIFKKPNADAEPINDGGAGWLESMFSVAEAPVFGNLEAVQNTLLHTYLYYLNKKVKDADSK